MNLVDLLLRLAVAAAAAGVVAAAFPGSRAGDRNARLIVGGATGVACLECLAAINVLVQSPVLWTFSVTVTPLAYLALLAGLLRILREGRVETADPVQVPPPARAAAPADPFARLHIVR
jgi:hypothetical protein